MVVELTIEDQYGVAIVAGHGLIAVFQVDDLEPNGPQRHFVRFPDALLVGAAMNQRSCDLPDPVRIRAFFEMCEPGNPAHVSEIPALSPETRKRTCYRMRIPYPVNIKKKQCVNLF